jgi:hypothetical protein
MRGAIERRTIGVGRSNAAIRAGAALFLLASTSLADEAADTATARSLGIEGVMLAEAGKCKEAIEKLERAEKLHHAPTTATRLAECEIATGKIVMGTERLQRVIREPLPPNAHPAFVAAVARAQKALAAALPRIATLRISVNAPPGAKLTLVIDDEPASEALLDTNRHIDPGIHQIEVRAPGYLPSFRSTALADGETKSVVLELHKDPNAQAHAAAPVLRVDSARTLTEAKPSKLPAILAFGLGAAGLGVGVYAATVVQRRSSLLERGCDSKRVCPPDLNPALDEAKTWATVSTAGFIAGGVGVASGIALLVLSGASSSSSAPKTKARLRPSFGATSVGLDGVF